MKMENIKIEFLQLLLLYVIIFMAFIILEMYNWSKYEWL